MEAKLGERIIVLIDMDCFYVQVEQKLSPEYQNKPCAVVQYNTWKGGGIIAVNYEARAKGVKRGARGEEAQRLCPDIHLFRVPEVRGKADLTRYREAGALVIEVLCEFSDCVERASIDEAYIDITTLINKKMQDTVSVDQIPNTFVIGWEKDDVQNWLQTIYEEEHLYKDRMLALAAVMVEKMRQAVYEKTGFRCSAGIAHNKMLAKLSCGLNKPNKQTVLPESSISILYNTIPVNKVRNLGGKFGELVIQKFDAKTMGDLMKIPKIQFISAFGEKNGTWMYLLSRGIDNEPVVARQLPKSIGCGKNFPGKSCLNTIEKVMHWIKQLSIELEERLIKDQENNKRAARLMTINLRNHTSSGFSVVSRSCPIYLYDSEKLAYDAFSAIQKFNSAADSSWNPPIWSLAISAGKFEDKVDNASCDIQNYFAKALDKPSTSNTSNIDIITDLIDADMELTGQTSKSFNFPDMEQKTKRSGEITNFFTKNTLTSTDDISNKNENSLNKNCEAALADANLVSPVEGNKDILKVPLLPKEEKPVISTSINMPENSHSEIKKKGFFARKLEERIKLSNTDKQTSGSEDVNNLVICNEKSLSSDSSPNMPSKSYTSEPSTSDAIAPINNDENSMSSVSSITDLDPELTKLCSKCNKLIPIWEEEEHADYHMAMDLSKELAKETTIRPIEINSKAQSNSKNKIPQKSSRKRGNMSKSSSSRAKKSFTQKNTLDSFIKNSSHS